jgi:hypothetical protein
MDRGGTVMNVTGDSIVCGIISHLMGNGFDDTEMEEGNSSSSSFHQKNNSVVIARRVSDQLGMMMGDVDLENESTDGSSSSSGRSNSY